MPTKLDRVQVLFEKELFKKLKFIAKIERRSLSSMVGSMVEESIKSKKYQSLKRLFSKPGLMQVPLQVHSEHLLAAISHHDHDLMHQKQHHCLTTPLL